MPIRPTTRALLLASLLTTAAFATAHEFWLQPPQFLVSVGATLSVHGMVGENFVGKSWPSKAGRVTRFVHASSAGVTELAASVAPTDTVATTVTFRQPGTHLVALATNNAYLELPGNEFNTYLKEEGLDNVLVQRQQQNQLTAPGREAYRRCAKALVQVGPVNTRDTARAYARPVGLSLELVPEQNPYVLRPGSLLTVRVLRDGQPLAGALVQVWQRSGTQPARATRFFSNQNGRVLFRVAAPGSYLVSTVNMVPATDRAKADWQSTWASLAFGYGAANKQ